MFSGFSNNYKNLPHNYWCKSQAEAVEDIPFVTGQWRHYFFLNKLNWKILRKIDYFRKIKLFLIIPYQGKIESCVHIRHIYSFGAVQPCDLSVVLKLFSISDN